MVSKVEKHMSTSLMFPYSNSPCARFSPPSIGPVGSESVAGIELGWIRAVRRKGTVQLRHIALAQGGTSQTMCPPPQMLRSNIGFNFPSLDMKGEKFEGCRTKDGLHLKTGSTPLKLLKTSELSVVLRHITATERHAVHQFCSPAYTEITTSLSLSAHVWCGSKRNKVQ